MTETDVGSAPAADRQHITTEQVADPPAEMVSTDMDKNQGAPSAASHNITAVCADAITASPLGGEVSKQTIASPETRPQDFEANNTEPVQTEAIKGPPSDSAELSDVLSPSEVASVPPSSLLANSGCGDDSDSDLTDCEDESEFKFEYEKAGKRSVLVIKPTKEQWNQFPAILDFARSRGVEADGCFKMVLPDELQSPIDKKPAQTLHSNAYRAKQKWDRSGWQVTTNRIESDFQRETAHTSFGGSVDQAIKDLRSLFSKNDNRQIRHVRYRPDVPAWTDEQRRKAGVPLQSPIHPLAGDKLDRTHTRVPGIHTPYVYESAAYFGAMFQIHAEDWRLLSLNHLYIGRKIWLVTPCTEFDKLEEKLGRSDKCSQFMRHRAEFLFPNQLDKLGVEYRIVDQRPGETIVILPDAYHEGFSTGYTLAEAKNYADRDWDTTSYQPCDMACNYAVAIPADHMALIEDPDQKQMDLCTAYGEETKRLFDEVSHDDAEAVQEGNGGMDESPNKKIKLVESTAA